jgi:hypothetical protein
MGSATGYGDRTLSMNSRAHPWMERLREGLTIGVLSTPFLTTGLAALQAGFLSNEHAHLIEKALLIRDRGRVEWIGFAYPPLPALMLLIHPSPTTATILASLLGGLLAWSVWKRLEILPFPAWIRAGLLLSAIATPTSLFLATQRLGMICALLLFFWSWRLYLAFTRHGRTDAAFLSALLIGFSFYASFYAPAFAIAFALSTPLFTRLRGIRHAIAILLVMLFPSALSIGAWMYLAWLFTGAPLGFLYEPGSSLLAALRPEEAFLSPTPMIRELLQRLISAPLYIGAGLLIAWQQPRRLPAYLIPLALNWLAWNLGWAFPRELSLSLWILFALSGIPARTPRRWGLPLLLLALLQIPTGWFATRQGEMERWWTVVFEKQAPEVEAMEREIATYLRSQTCGSVLADDRHAYRIIALAGTACPFILPPDPIFDLAVSQPARFVAYVLVPDTGDGFPTPLEARYRQRPPTGFRLEITWPGWKLYRKVSPEELRPPETLRAQREERFPEMKGRSNRRVAPTTGGSKGPAG